MNNKESVVTFYNRHGQKHPESSQFNIYRREEFVCGSTSLPPNRRDFYKISLVLEGEGIISTADKTIHIKNNAITFMNPLIPYSWEPISENQTGYFCLFTEDFISQNLKNESLSKSSLFKVGGNHVFILSEERANSIGGIFENMLNEIASGYTNKYELLRSYVQIIMHEALKIQPPETFYKPLNASERITSLFTELLERQFPIDSPNQVLKFKNANEFALQLNVHTNTLNRALKEITGKTTTEWIAERMTKEAKALLQYSSWDIAEIGYCLGFEHASNFVIFFKKQTQETPLQYRKFISVGI
ncbi:AraC family transcriptional regulator [Sphingobacterium sp. SRCM116780]|uniref:AraC family transcriptional regulator n=1 Tax=Sphingobacterium sp. SRCM116780 TaxID=2907623 RepID=UPI001F430B04|nr:helix-turn-helix transcriptional regulator [Sphingobacterium sp. SRCM116780]UIR57888.1 AraC family transcriptional regulator [Sphingobacterium sp. SRCM116780]